METLFYNLGTSACETICRSYSPLSIDELDENVKTFDEKICISYRDGRKWRNMFFAPGELKEKLPKLRLEYGKAYYITNQSVYGRSKKRTSDKLFSFHNIIIDIDAHEYLKNNDLDYEFQEKVDDLIYRIKRDTCDIPPNFIVKTSRGIQCWWNFEETSKVLQFAYKRAVNTLCRVMSDILDDYNYNNVFQVDMKSSKKPLGLFRLPGSYNPLFDRYTEIITYHNEKYDFNDFNDYITDFYDLHWDTERKKKPKAKKAKKNSVVPISRAQKGYLPLMVKRKSIIQGLFDKNKVIVGNREVALFLFYNTVRQLPFEDLTPEEQTRLLNKQLDCPLRDSELQAIFNNPKIYKISNKLFYEYLGITEADVKEVYMTKSNFSRDYERKIKKLDRNKEIVRRYEIKNQSILGISKDMGISRNTVKTVLRDFGLLPLTQKQETTV